MAEDLQDKMDNQSFWDEVDSLQAMLQEEEKEEHHTAGKISEEKRQDPVRRQVRPRRRASKGTLIALYCIITAELTAIFMVAGSWYLWMY